MQRTLRNTVAVLIVTLFTAIAVFATIQVTGHLLGGTQTAIAQPAVQPAAQPAASGGLTGQAPASQQLVCPRTGCSASSCHAAP